jgi:hypothetical protein
MAKALMSPIPTANRADSYVYYGPATGFDVSSRDDIATFGARWAPIVVGK